MQEVVPDGITVEWDPEKSMLWFRAIGQAGAVRGGGSYAPRSLLLETFGSIEGRITGACRGALDDLQDFVDEATTEPWPGTKVVPVPGALIHGGQVHLWYGDIEEPALRLRPIPLEDPLKDPLGCRE
jgi:hypothetical protein